MRGVVAIAAGGWHSLALKADGSILAWGDNMHGQLGNGTYTSSNVAVGTPLVAVSIAAGLMHSAAVKADGTAWYWEAQYDGGSSPPGPSTPTQISGLSKGRQFIELDFEAAGRLLC